MNPKYHDIICERAGADTAVILLHGILSAPQFFDFLLPEIPAHVSVYGILLAGHGNDPEALARASMQQWKQQIHVLMQKLLPRYPKIIIAAHSMGTLFALKLAAEYPEQIVKMLLLDVPLRVHLTLSGAGCSLLAACGLHPANPQFSAMQHAYSILPDCNPLHYAGWIPRYQELFREIDAVNAIRMRIKVPCEVYQSAADELVSPDALPLLRAMPSVRLHVLRGSTHFYFPPQDQHRLLYTWRKIIRQTCLTEDERSSEHKVKEYHTMMKFYQSKESGEIIAVKEGEAADLTGMEEIIANTVDAAKEKHVPVISREGQTVTVAVGSVLHPMTDVHYIAWILLETKNGEERKALQPGEEPVAQFYVAEDDEIIAAYEYCTLHGIWQAVPASDR